MIILPDAYLTFQWPKLRPHFPAATDVRTKIAGDKQKKKKELGGRPEEAEPKSPGY